jgi:hypothetical protein
MHNNGQAWSEAVMDGTARSIMFRCSVSGPYPSSGVLSETGCVSVLKPKVEAPTLLGSLGRANLNHWAVRFPKRRAL